MTREEAIEKCASASAWSSASCGGFVDGLVSLGILKLEEPKSARERFMEEMLSMGFLPEGSTLERALKAFDASQK